MKYLSNFKKFENMQTNISDEDVYVKKSTIPNSGKGLFAKRDFEENEIICEFTGEIIDEEEVDIRNSEGGDRGSYFIDLGDQITMDVYNSDCLARYANDAEGYNKVKNRKNNSIIFIDELSAYIVASEPIKKDQEIFLKYGDEYWANI